MEPEYGLVVATSLAIGDVIMIDNSDAKIVGLEIPKSGHVMGLGRTLVDGRLLEFSIPVMRHVWKRIAEIDEPTDIT